MMMIERLCIVGLVGSCLITRTLAQSEVYNANSVDCDQGAGRGYATLAALNQDIDNERQRILAGGTPQDNYFFVLCPNTAFDTTTPLVPALDNILIGCGESLSSAETCTLTGGETQVEIGTYANSVHPVETVELRGITFAGFSTAAVAGVNATDDTRVIIEDAIFTEADSPGGFLIDQTVEDPEESPFSVEIRDSVVTGVTLSGGFVNEGGQLSIRNVNATDANFAGAFISLNDGTLQLENVDVSDSEIQNVVSVEGGAEANLDGLDVSELSTPERVVLVTGAGSSANIARSTVDNVQVNTEGNDWVAYQATNGAILSVTDTTFSNNAGARSFISGIGGSEVTIVRVDIVNNNGARALSNTIVSGIVEANTGTTITILDSTISGTDNFFSGLLLSFGSQLDASGVCITDSDTQAVVFLSQDSTYEVSNNAIEEGSDSAACEAPGFNGADRTGRLALETPGSDCFGDGDDCNVGCFPFADYETCAEIVETTTQTPTVFPSDFPSSVPTMTPVPTTTTQSPTALTALPTLSPTQAPTSAPTNAPSLAPATSAPTFEGETAAPSTRPVTQAPTPNLGPDELPTFAPSQLPTIPLTPAPTRAPSITALPTAPTDQPTSVPTGAPTGSPTDRPTRAPSITALPTAPTDQPTSVPTTDAPTGQPTTLSPTSAPSVSPTVLPTDSPTLLTAPPSPAPTKCIPRPIYVSARKPDPTKGKGGRRLKNYSSKGKGISSYSNKGKGKSSYSYKGKGSQYADAGVQQQVTTPTLPYCDDVFQPILVYKGKGKGGRRLRGL